MARTIRLQRTALLHIARGPWEVLWLVSPRLDLAAVRLLLPLLERREGEVCLLTDLSAGRLASGEVEPAAVEALRSLPRCSIRSFEGLSASSYVAAPAGPALISSAPLVLSAMDGPAGLGAILPQPEEVLAQLLELWEAARPLEDRAWKGMVQEAQVISEARTVGREIARVGAFVRVSVRGTRRTRRLDPRDFGASEGDWGRAVRPVEVALYRLDEVVRAREELERILEEKGLEWNGHYLVPRHFLEREWPRLFANREQLLRERLTSPEGHASLKAQLSQARQELEAFFADLFIRVPEPGLDAPRWIDQQVTRVLAETVAESVLEESGLEYRVLTVLPEDDRSREELSRLLQDPKLRSVQLTFNF